MGRRYLQSMPDYNAIHDIRARLRPDDREKYVEGSLSQTELAVIVQKARHGQLHVTLKHARFDTGLVATIFPKGTKRGEPPPLLLKIYDIDIEPDPEKKWLPETRQRFLDAFIDVALSAENTRTCRFYSMGGITDRKRLDLLDPLPERPTHDLDADDLKFFVSLDKKLYTTGLHRPSHGSNAFRLVTTIVPRNKLGEDELKKIKDLHKQDKIYLSRFVHEGRTMVAINTHPWYAIDKPSNKRHLVDLTDVHFKADPDEEPQAYRNRLIETFDPLIRTEQNQANLNRYRF